MADSVTCPFCGFTAQLEYHVQLHIEEQHTDNSGFVAQDVHSPDAKHSESACRDSVLESGPSTPPSMPEGTWTRCTRPNCGEWVPLSDADEHLEVHAAIALANEQDNESSPPLPPRNRSRSPHQQPMGNCVSRQSQRPSPKKLKKRESQKRPVESNGSTSLLHWLAGTSTIGRPTPPSSANVQRLEQRRAPGRLGKRELGPYAYEESMPERVRKHLKDGARPREVQMIGRGGRLVRKTMIPNETAGLVPVLADLCAMDEGTATTYFCHSSVRHIRKLYCDGNFCGFWNIQMLLTYIQHTNPLGPQTLPDVLQIQDVIENAWDDGVCSYSRTETGGIRNTRKWIGTQEALAFFIHIGIKVDPLSIVNGEEGSGKLAADDLLDYVEAYFMSASETAEAKGTSLITKLAPIYFQRTGHSMTIVGLEKRTDGSRNLLLFDSSFETSTAMMRFIAGQRGTYTVSNLLKPYRRSDLSLTRWDEFELIVPNVDT